MHRLVYQNFYLASTLQEDEPVPRMFFLGTDSERAYAHPVDPSNQQELNAFGEIFATCLRSVVDQPNYQISIEEYQ